MQFVGQSDPYGGAAFAAGGAAPYGATHLTWKPKAQRRRMNVLAICLSLFLPWLIFCGVCAMYSFEMHYRKPATCQSLTIIIISVLVLAGLIDVVYMIWKRRRGDFAFGNSSWVLFLCICGLVAVAIGGVLGSRNYWENSGLYYDVMAMNNYAQVDPSRMRGQEIMDAGRVVFINGTRLDTTKSMGFKNSQTYCVAPITGGSVVGNPPLAHYDFWAVGKGCCSGQASAGDFKCDDYDDVTARSGVRLMSDEDRDFFRLAVQQAQSAYQIKATHPLFFHWVKDSDATTQKYIAEAYKTYFVGMCSFFGFQLVLVYVAAICFSKFMAN